jgi:hypothetical protein
VKSVTIPRLHRFYQHRRIMNSTASTCRILVGGGFAVGGLKVAIQDYVRSLAAAETVSKDQVFRFLEMQFARADRNHDGELDVDELAVFVNAIAHPETDQR